MLRSHVFDALRFRGYRYYWFSSVLVSSARTMQSVVLGWLVLERTDSAFLVTVAASFNFLPMLGLGLFTGVLADRLNRRVVLISTQLISASVMLLLGILIATDVVTTLEIMAASLMIGLVWAIDWPCRQIIVPDLAGEANIVNGVALDQGAFHLMSIIGSVLAGLVIAALGEGLAYMMMAAMYVAAALFLVQIGPTQQKQVRTRGHLREDVLAGVSYCIRTRAIFGVLLIMLLAHSLLFPFRQLLPVFARDILGTGPEGLGYLAAAPGVGALLGAAIVASLGSIKKPGLLFSVSAVAMGVMAAIFALSGNYLFSLLMLTVYGLAVSFYVAMQASIPLRLADPAMRGRVMGIFSLVVGIMPVGMMVFGAVTDAVGAPAATLIGSVSGVVLIGAVVFLIPGLRRQT